MAMDVLHIFGMHNDVHRHKLQSVISWFAADRFYDGARDTEPRESIFRS